jgi:hypothetical protein
LVTPQQVVTGIDFQLALGGAISGRVTDAATGLPLANYGIDAALLDGQGNWVNGFFTRTNKDGVYTVWGLPLGDYKVQSCCRPSGDSHTDEFFQDKGSFNDADVVNLSSTEVTIPNVDFTLASTAPIVVAPVSPLTVAGGATVEYDIQVSDVPDLAAAQTTFNFDPAVFTVNSVAVNPGLNGCLSTDNQNTAGQVGLALICTQANTGAPLTLWTVALRRASQYSS